MRNHLGTVHGSILVLVLVSAALAGCGLDDLLIPAPQLGDSMVRESDGMALVYVPAGDFLMGIDHLGMRYALDLCRTAAEDLGPAVCRGSSYGNEMPAHQVSLDAFWIDRTEVTNRQYDLCVDRGQCTPPQFLGSFTRDSYFKDGDYVDYPVVWVTHGQAAAYCDWAGGRLPTEAEWEYAARGPENLVFPWGNDFDPTLVNYCDAGCASGVVDPAYNDGYPETAPVGSFPGGASWTGALDMAGNVREWVADWFGYYSSDAQTNPKGPAGGTTHIPKGGSWLDRRDDLRSSNRGENTPDYSRHKVGFRCAMDTN